MKKTLLLLASAALLFVGCAKEQQSNGVNGGLTEATFTANMATEGAKASMDGDGAAANVNRCIMEIYYGGELFTRQYAKVTDKKATFTAQVVSNRTYTVAFWADNVADASTDAGLATDNYYTTTSLKEISIIGDYIGNDDARDAFYHVGEYPIVQGGSSFPDVLLTRPFAQMNVITTDWDKAASVTGLAPDKVDVTLKNAMVAFNALTGEASGSKTLNYEADVYSPVAQGAEKTLSMDYLFASIEKAAIDIDWKALHDDDADVEHSFTAVPYQRNYRTNIKGALLTTQGQWTVTVDSDWDGDGTSDEDPWLVNYFEAGSIAAANEALKTQNAVSIENPSDLGTAIVIPVEQDGNNVYIKVSGASAGDIVVKKADEGPATLDIESDAKTLYIDLPNTHVNVNKGVNYTAITAKTGDNTLVIGKEVKVKKLTTTKGAVVVNGQVEELSSNVVAQINISSAEGLMTYAAALNAGKYTAHYANLVADIDMTGKEWVPMSASGSSLRGFDGEEHTISNLTTTTQTSTYYGLFMSAAFDIKNVTVKDAVLTYPETAEDQARAGVIVGWLFSGNVTNCHVDGAVIKASQKIGGIVGNIEASTTNPMTISDCSVKNLTVSSNCNDLVYQAAGIAGYIQQVSALNITVKNCSVENITVNDPFTGSNNIGWHNHSFIGNIENTKENTVIALENNTVDSQLPVERTAYTTDYFGWAGNAEKGSNYKAVITIDGEPWTPNYPVKIVGGKGYATLAAALAAATEGQTVQILKAGDYTVQTLSTKAAVVEATVDGVVFNHTAGYKSWVSAQDGHVKTVKNITWNVGEANYQYFNNTNLENCTVNGQLCTHGSNKFKDCTFINEEGYNFWVYGNIYTEFDNCTFTCPGKNDGVAGCGSALNCYNEGSQTPTPVLVVKNCTFTAKEASNKYSAIYIKPETAFDIRISNSTCNDKFCTGDKSGSKLWNVKSHSNLETKVTVDGKLVYANGTVLDITTADQLMAFAAKVNAGNNFDGKTVYLGADIDMSGKAWIPIGNVNDYPGKVFSGVFDGQNHIISNLTCTDNTEGNACAALFGGVYGKIMNLTLTNVNISSKHYAGGIGAYCSSSNMDIENCHVIGGTITSSPEYLGSEYDNGDKAGGIMGYAGEAGKITNCSVEGVTVRAFRDLGGILGAGSSTISGCTVKNSSIIQDNTNAYKTGIDTYHEILGRDMGATLVGNTYENVTVKSEN